jgi:hypothetical protein
MDLNRLDVEAVAKARVSRAESQKTNYWSIGMLVGVIIGFAISYKVNIGIGYGVVILSICALVYYMNTLSKKQNAMKQKLLREWDNEKKKVVENGKSC